MPINNNGQLNNMYQSSYQPLRNNYTYSPASVGYNNTYLNSMNNGNSLQTNNSNLIWVQGEVGARGYILPNNTTVALWDSESQTIYIKSVDMNGRPSMTILDYVDRANNVVDVKDNDNKEEKVDLSGFVTKDQFDELVTKMNDFQIDLQKKFNDFKSRTNNPTINKNKGAGSK